MFIFVVIFFSSMSILITLLAQVQVSRTMDINNINFKVHIIPTTWVVSSIMLSFPSMLLLLFQQKKKHFFRSYSLSSSLALIWLLSICSVFFTLANNVLLWFRCCSFISCLFCFWLKSLVFIMWRGNMCALQRIACVCAHVAEFSYS